ncbi:MAG: S8 family serine peptidase [Bacillota bacterium]
MTRIIVSLLALFGLLASLASPAALAQPVGQPGTGRKTVEAPAVPGEYLIRFTPGLSAAGRAQIAEELGAQIIDQIKPLDAHLIAFPALKAKHNSQERARILAALKENPNVLYVEPNFIYQAVGTPNDPGVTQQWAWGKIQAYAAWDVAQGSSSTVIAIVDTGIQLNHPDLDAKIVPGYDFVSGDSQADDGHGHGTHVGGSAAAETNNATGGAGTCPGCSLMPVRVLDNNGSGTLANVANGITWAADRGAKVINLSLGASTGATTLENAINYAWNRGAFLACAAGNSNTSSPSYPAYYENCFAVASTNSSDARSYFSNYGNWVEAAAPGEGIYSTWLNGGYHTISGTSMATPHVAGLAGLLASQGLTNTQVRDRICATSDPISGTGAYWTCGRINAHRAVTGDENEPPPPPPRSPLSNGGFENGTEPWQQASTGGYQLITTHRPRTGSYSAWLGGYDYAYDRVYQAVTIPPDSTLTFWWYMTSVEGPSIAYDHFRVRLYTLDGNLIATLRTRSNRDLRGAWQQDSVSLAPYAGQTLYVHFSITTDYLYPTSFYVDDVAVQ